MKMKISSIIYFFCFLLHHFLAKDLGRKVYIIYLGDLPEFKTTDVIDDHHHKLLTEVVGGEDIAKEAKLYSYRRSFNGFAANLLPHEAQMLSENEVVVSVFLSKKQRLHTTRSWDYIGMPIDVARNDEIENNLVIGVLDTGIYIQTRSFNDDGYGPPPETWRGKCQTGINFSGCNNKVIGAQYFDIARKATSEELSPADFEGHGSHTSSTAAGVPVTHASLYGIAEGTARGGVPRARIAMYKVCWIGGCPDEDILAGFDAAIDDGVDIISISVGRASHDYSDGVAIGSYHAVKKGILVSASAGNDGLGFSKVENSAPWIMTVAASTTDRVIYVPLELGNGQQIHGNAINLNNMEAMCPLMSLNSNGTGHCSIDGLPNEALKGKIVYCRGYVETATVKSLGGVGVIMASDSNTDTPYLFTPGPVSVVTSHYANLIETYIDSTTNPMAIIYISTEEKTTLAPMVASFSSRGPEDITQKILKPDLVAPGDAILASFTSLKVIDPTDDRRVEYSILSGTSMAAPHAASAAAYLKSFHPDWSPAMIRSALMTTAKPMNLKPEGAELASGAGNIDPVAALDPGLVYDIHPDSYANFFCKNCSVIANQIGYDGLNYPSFHFQLISPNDTSISSSYERNVTSIGGGDSEYRVSVNSPDGLSIMVEPETLLFSKSGEQKSYRVTLQGQFLEEKQWYLSGSIVWSDSVHFVRSPVLVYRPPTMQSAGSGISSGKNNLSLFIFFLLMYITF